MSFFLDWWMLIGLGVFITLVERIIRQYKPKEDSFFVYTMSILTLVVFFTLSVGLFCELGWSAEWGYDNPVLGRMNEFFFNTIKNMPGYRDYYARHPYASSTDFMYSSGYEFLKSGHGGNWFSNWLGGMFGFNVPFDRLMPWNTYPDPTVLVTVNGHDITVGLLKEILAANANWDSLSPEAVVYTFTDGTEVTKAVLDPVLTASLVQHPMFLFGGILMFCTYPAWLYLGTQLGYMLWGRKKGDIGVLGLL
ncbi:MAG: hypothetical protein ACTSU5_21285 [Promethearchaeota archaeon]